MSISSGPFVATFKTDNAGVSSSNQITIPAVTGNTFNCWVDWGDGSTSTLINSQSDAQWTKTYSSAGTYVVKIYGMFAISFNNGGDVLKILSVNRWGSINLSNCSGLFMGCTNLIITATDIPNLNYSSLTFRSFFRDCTSIRTIPNINSWNVSNVTETFAMFSGATLFNQSLDNWNVSKLTNTVSMFSNASSFNSSLASWNLASCTSTQNMFYNAVAFNQPLSSWNVSTVTNMAGMFLGASAFNQPLSSWNVSNVTNMIEMFRATPFNQDISGWDVSKVTSFSYMFFLNTAFNQNIGSWNVSSATNLAGMFKSASGFNQNISSWNTSNVTSMAEMFMFSSAFNQNISSWNTSKVTLMNNMFQSASAFNQNLGTWDVRAVTNMTSMFLNITLSTANYNCILAGWAAQVVKNNVVFSGGNSKYDAVTGTCNGTAGRNTLTTTYTWTITDGGPA